MKYIRVYWKHSEQSDLILLFSELDDDFWETRKVEVYSDGHCGFADHSGSSGDTELGLEPLPPFDEINSDPQFQLVEISRAEFEEVWSRRYLTTNT
jgi:uncharacterized protein DUF6881